MLSVVLYFASTLPLYRPTFRLIGHILLSSAPVEMVILLPNIIVPPSNVQVRKRADYHVNSLRSLHRRRIPNTPESICLRTYSPSLPAATHLMLRSTNRFIALVADIQAESDLILLLFRLSVNGFSHRIAYFLQPVIDVYPTGLEH